MPQLGIIIFENKPLSTFIGNPSGTYGSYTKGTEDCPNVLNLANNYRPCMNYTGVTNPSLPNYCGMFAGSFLGCAPVGSTSGGVDTPSPAVNGFAGNQPNIFAQLEDAGFSWKNYAEDITYWDAASTSVKDYYPGGTAWKTSSQTPYFVNRHAGGTFFGGPDNITAKPAAAGDNGLHDFRTPTGAGTWVQGSGTLLDDIANNSLPDFFVVSPNLPNCGHGYIAGGSLQSALGKSPDNWLGGNTVISSSYSQASPKFPGVTTLLSSMRAGSTLIVTLDNNGTNGTTKTLFIIVGSPYLNGGVWTPAGGATANHFWLLWSISKFFSKGKLGTVDLNNGATSLTYTQETRYTSLTNTQVAPLVSQSSNASLTPSTFAFQTPVAPGAVSAQASFTLSNATGTATLNVASVRLNDTVNFTISAGANIAAVAAGATATIGVKFSPPSTASFGATFPCTLTVTDDSGGVVGSTQTASISATTTALANTPHATLAPPAGTTVNMGTVAIGGSVTTQVTITNDGNASLTITGIAIGPSGRQDNIPARFTTTQ